MYHDTMHSAMGNRKRLVEEAPIPAQSSRKPHPPVLPTNYSYLFYDRLGKLAPLPEVIYPHECWVVYGKQEDLATFSPDFPCEDRFAMHLKRLEIKIAAIKVPEYNPDVPFSYAYGNTLYSKSRMGRLAVSNLPDQAAYAEGLYDAVAIVTEMQNDNSQG